MGVKLTELIIKRPISFDDLKNKTIVIDFSNAAYQFLSSIRQQDGTLLMDSHHNVTSHLMGIWTRFSNLISRNIKLVIVLDGKMPKLKSQEQQERESRKVRAEQKLEKAKKAKDIELMQRYSKQTTRLNQQMINESKELMQAMGLPIIQAPAESDAMGAFMCEKGDVYAVASSDYDSLLFGAPRMITNLTLSQRRRLPSGAIIKISPELIDLKENLQNLKISQDQLIVLGILIGTDYNPKGVPRIGPKTALKLVNQYKNFDTLFKEVKADFNWKQIYAIFKSMPIMKNYQIKFSQPNPTKIVKLLVDKHDFSEERVNKTLSLLLKESEKTSLDRWI